MHRGTVGRIVVGALLVLLSALLVALTVEAASQDVRNHRLQHHGVRVQVTVTHCLGRASGTGITVVGYICRGTFTLAGREYEDVITGPNRLYHRGDSVSGVTDPDHPSNLSAAAAVEGAPPTWRTFVTPELVSTMILVVIGLYVYRRRWAR